MNKKEIYAYLAEKRRATIASKPKIERKEWGAKIAAAKRGKSRVPFDLQMQAFAELLAEGRRVRVRNTLADYIIANARKASVRKAATELRSAADQTGDAIRVRARALGGIEVRKVRRRRK